MTAGSQCAWLASSSSDWITITSGSIGIGSGEVTYSLAANTGATGRKGAITGAGKTFLLKQQGN